MTPPASSLLMTLLLQTILWPVVTVLVGIGIGHLWSRRLPRQALPLVSAVAIGAAFLAVYPLIYGQFVLPPVQALDWVPLFLLGALIVFAVDDAVGFAPRVRLATQALCALLAGGLLLWPILGYAGSMRAALTLIGVAALWFGGWTYLDRANPGTVPSGVTLLIVAAGTAAISVMTGSVLVGQLSGALAAALGGWLLWNWPRPRWPLGHAGTAMVTLTLGSLLLIGRFYSDTPLSITLMLLAAVAAQWPVGLAQRSREGLRAPAAAVLTGLIALVPIVLAIGFTLFFHMPSAGGFGEY